MNPRSRCAAKQHSIRTSAEARKNIASMDFVLKDIGAPSPLISQKTKKTALATVNEELSRLPQNRILRFLQKATGSDTPHLPEPRTLHAEFPLFYAMLSSLRYQNHDINHIWHLLMQGIAAQRDSQDRSPQRQTKAPTDAISNHAAAPDWRDNSFFREASTEIAQKLSVENEKLAVWTGEGEYSAHAIRCGFTPFESTRFGRMVIKLVSKDRWCLQAPLLHILSHVFATRSPRSVHVFLRACDGGFVPMQNESGVIKIDFAHIPFVWHAVHIQKDALPLEIDANGTLTNAWRGFTKLEHCVQAMFDFYIRFPERLKEATQEYAPPCLNDANYKMSC